MNITIGIVDDHQLFASSLKALLETNEHFQVSLVAYGGKDLQRKIARMKKPPELILLDVNMTDMGGYDTAQWIRQNYPRMKIAALSMNKDENVVIRMLRAGCCGYFVKNINYEDLERALLEIHSKGYYNGDECNVTFRRLAIDDTWYKVSQPNEKEMIFLQHACSDLTYIEIAGLMSCSPRTVDGYRESLFLKFKVQSRVGLCLEALRRGIIPL